MRRVILFGLYGALTLPAMAMGRAAPDALTVLMDGNRRFATARPLHPHATVARRSEVAKGQHPPAVVVGCADSRIPPEVVLDQGLGDVFVVRSAGNVIDDAALGSIEFAVAKLGARLVLVLGHERCGAVEAALAGAPVPGHVQAIVDAIRPHLKLTTTKGPGDALEEAVDDNVVAVVTRLRAAEPVLAPMVRDGSLRVVGGVYDLDTGRVRVLDVTGKP